MATARSAARTCGEDRSASEYTATASRPSSWHARTMRSAISPRLATSTRCICGESGLAGGRGRVSEEQEEAATEEDVLAGRRVVHAANVGDPWRVAAPGGFEKLGDRETPLSADARGATDSNQSEGRP